MKDKTVQYYAKRIADIVTHVDDDADNPMTRQRIISRSNGGFTLYGEYIDKYDRLIETLLVKEGWGDKYSERHLSNEVSDLIVEALNSDDPVSFSALFEDLVTEYEQFSEKRTVFVPLSGIRLGVDEFTIGNVSLVGMTDELMGHILEHHKNIIMSMPYDSEEKERLIQEAQDVLEKNRGKVCARFTTVAEHRRAGERAKEEARRVIDLLVFATPAIYDERLQIAVGIEHEAAVRAVRLITVLDEQGRQFNRHYDNVGPYQDFEVNEATINRLNDIGVMEVSAILQKPTDKITEFENTILRGIHWLASALRQTERENAFLNLITCVETYLTPRDGNPIGTAIAEGVALILGKNLSSRKAIKEKIKNYYRKRSGVSHGGEKAVLDSDYREMLETAGSLTVWMIQHHGEFKSMQDLLQWIEDQKLS